MIVWLASYPRCGNTLLRTVLKQCFGLLSYFDESQGEGLSPKTLATFGHAVVEGAWADFYQKAAQSNDIVGIKTHLPPRDAYKTIYVVRDGRSAIVSYWHFHQAYHGEAKRSLLDLALGIDAYGSWAEHYKNWGPPREDTMIVRYEDLVKASPQLLERIAAHIGYSGTIEPWRNPFDRLNKDEPTFFRKGEVEWQPTEIWTELVNAAFLTHQGDVLTHLGYEDPVQVAAVLKRTDPEILALIDLNHKLGQQARNLQMVCDERLQVINDLTIACDERLALINTLSAQLAEGAGEKPARPA